MRRVLILLPALLAIGGCTNWGDRPNPQVTRERLELHGQAFRVETVATGLYVPWSLAWLPDGRLLVAQRNGELAVVEDGRTRRVHRFGEVQEIGEGGLMGLTLSPNFAADRVMYISYTAKLKGEPRNVIARYRLREDLMPVEPRVLLDDIPAASHHDGLRLTFGPDGMLWTSTGDAGRGDRAQQRSSLAGKFLRMTPEGKVPPDNPFRNSLVWTMGHRDSQGFDWHPVTGELYAVEHGPTAPLDGLDNAGDELNLIRKGQNYGWPKYRYTSNTAPYIAPIYTWKDPIAPAGAAFYRGDRFPAWRNRLFFCTLRGQALYCVTISDRDPATITDITPVLHAQLGRLRAVAVGPDGYLYLTTSNRDGRGKPLQEDDRVVRLVPLEGER